MRDEKTIQTRLEQLRGQLLQWGTPDLMVFKTSNHPYTDPHMGDANGFRHRLDLSALRSMNWDEIAKEWEPWWNSLFYWPSHRADLIAIPGPAGKTWFEGLQQMFGQDEV